MRALQYALHVRRRVHKAGNAVRDDRRPVDIAGLRYAVRQKQPADALARQRKGLGIRVDHRRMGHNLRHPRDFGPVIDEFAIGFVRDYEDTVSEFPLLFREHCLYPAEQLLGVNDTARVIRRVQDEGPRLFTDCRAERSEIREKSLGVGRNQLEHSSVVLDIVLVLREIGLKTQHLISRV